MENCLIFQLKIDIVKLSQDFLHHLLIFTLQKIMPRQDFVQFTLAFESEVTNLHLTKSGALAYNVT